MSEFVQESPGNRTMSTARAHDLGIVCATVSVTAVSSYSLCIHVMYQSKKDGKDQESIHSSTTPDPEYHMGK